MSEDFIWFKEHYNELKNEYGNAFLAIKNKHVIGVYASYADGVKKTSQTEEIGTFIIQECNQQYDAYQCCIASMNFV